MRTPLRLAVVAAALSLAMPAMAEPPMIPETTTEPAAAAVGAAHVPSLAATPEPLAEIEKPKPIPPSLIAKINLSSQRMEVIVDGVSRHSWAISSGRSGYASPRGTYRVQWTAKMWHSRKYDMAPMPHAVFFTGGVAVHATSAVGMLGRPASHGCIRLAPANAATFYALVQRHGNKQTQIQVFGSAGEPVARRRDRAGSEVAERRGRDQSLIQRAAYQGRTVYQLPPGSPHAGRDSFVQNGVRYVRMR